EGRQHEGEKGGPGQEPDQTEREEIAGTVRVPDRRIAGIDEAEPVLPGHDVDEGVPLAHERGSVPDAGERGGGRDDEGRPEPAGPAAPGPPRPRPARREGEPDRGPPRRREPRAPPRRAQPPPGGPG